jgi:hypothetical protein
LAAVIFGNSKMLYSRLKATVEQGSGKATIRPCAPHSILDERMVICHSLSIAAGRPHAMVARLPNNCVSDHAMQVRSSPAKSKSITWTAIEEKTSRPASHILQTADGRVV